MVTQRERTSILALTAVLLTATAACADPTGTTYNFFMDTTVTDGVGDAIGNHTTFGTPLTFDGNDELVEGDIIDFQNGTYNDANDWWVGEQSSHLPSGNELVQYWAFGDDNGDATPPDAGDYGPLFTNTLLDDPSNRVNWGIENGLYWNGLLSSSGRYAEIVSIRFWLTFDGGNPSTPPVEIFPVPDEAFVGGSGTEDDKFFLFFPFDPADFAGDPTDFHVDIEVRHVPEPGSALLAMLGVVWIIVGHRRRRAAKL